MGSDDVGNDSSSELLLIEPDQEGHTIATAAPVLLSLDPVTHSLVQGADEIHVDVDHDGTAALAVRGSARSAATSRASRISVARPSRPLAESPPSSRIKAGRSRGK
ncbi:hypothetical protein GCM10022234_21760 [Aeromicrobium panaciterrae]